jgi:hypothetical protein
MRSMLRAISGTIKTLRETIVPLATTFSFDQVSVMAKGPS